VYIDIQRVGVEALERYAKIPISFRVDSIFRVKAIGQGLGGFQLVEEPVEQPYLKDYDVPTDAQHHDEARPVRWSKRWDVSKWGFFLATAGERPVGGATVAIDTPGADRDRERRDLAVLWDIRVHPDCRGGGIGQRLFQHAAGWARAQGCRQFKVETQNINVRACRFYARQGCELGAIHRYAYAGRPDLAHEAMLLWYLDL
jgi:GNAT superfamily N-acetyltransferase